MQCHATEMPVDFQQIDPNGAMRVHGHMPRRRFVVFSIVVVAPVDAQHHVVIGDLAAHLIERFIEESSVKSMDPAKQ